MLFRQFSPAALAFILAFASVHSALAQTGKSVPHDGYFGGFGLYYDGQFSDARKYFRDAAHGGFASTEGRWVDSICFHTMIGECYYQEGNLVEALDQYSSAVKLFLAHRDWMLRAEIPSDITAESNIRTTITWGKSTRATKLGQFGVRGGRYSLIQGSLDGGAAAATKGGVVAPPTIYPAYIAEIVRCTSVAILRRAEILGPASEHDPITAQVLDACLRRPGPPNHWSQCWIELQLGAAYVAANRPAEAASEFTKSLMAGGQYDHSLTSLALLELGKLAFKQEKYDAAITLFLEATYTGAHFERFDVMEEAFRYASLAHLVKGGQGTPAALAPAATWSRQGRGKCRLLQASLYTSLGEILAANGDLSGASAALGQARSAMTRSDMLASQFGARFNYEFAKVQFMVGNSTPANAALAAAMAFQKVASRRLFQMALIDKLVTNGTAGITERTADLLYTTILREPTPADWVLEPMETLAVLSHAHPAPYEHWLEIALSRKEYEKALNIADRIRRHRFFATLPLGGRVLALRWVLEAPDGSLSPAALLQRQNLLLKFPKYGELSRKAREAQAALDKLPLVPEDEPAKNRQKSLLDALAKASAGQEAILAQMALQRQASDFVFPPLLETKEIQRSLPEGTLVLVYISTSRNVHAFALSRENYAWFKLATPAKVKSDVIELLKQWGHVDRNQPVGADDLLSGKWKQAATQLLAQLANNTGPEEWGKYQELVVVPDNVLWYLPFEALQVPGEEGTTDLGAMLNVRYCPTLSLVLPDKRGRRPLGRTAIYAGKLWVRDEPSVTADVASRLMTAVDGSSVLPPTLPASSSVMAGLVQRLVVLSDLDDGDKELYSLAPMQADKGKAGSSLSDWFALPWAGPESVVLPGFHTAAENSLKRGGTGDEMFLTICGLMSGGTRSILISRWRTAGQTSLDLMREYVQELPHSRPREAWRRSLELSKAGVIDPDLEPRVKMTSGAKEVHSKHPFFWAGYLLVDCEPPFEATAKEVAGEEKKEEDKVAGEEGEDKPDSKTDSP
jgi:tetratricopeptide (TPR) repeat protein